MDEHQQSVSRDVSRKISTTKQIISRFWPEKIKEIKSFRGGQPFSQRRIKKIMKLDDTVSQVSNEVPILFAKAINMFVEELTLHGRLELEKRKKVTLQRKDIAKSVLKNDHFHFLIDIVLENKLKFPLKKEGLKGFTDPQLINGNQSMNDDVQDENQMTAYKATMAQNSLSQTKSASTPLGNSATTGIIPTASESSVSEQLEQLPKSVPTANNNIVVEEAMHSVMLTTDELALITVLRAAKKKPTQNIIMVQISIPQETEPAPSVSVNKDEVTSNNYS